MESHTGKRIKGEQLGWRRGELVSLSKAGGKGTRCKEYQKFLEEVIRGESWDARRGLWRGALKRNIWWGEI